MRASTGAAGLLLLTALLAAAWPAAAGVAVILSGSDFSGGEPFSTGFTADNAGGPPAEVYFGVMLPDGATLVSVTPSGTLAGPIGALSELVPFDTVPAGGARSAPAALSGVIPTAGIPTGTYRFFAGLVVAGGLADGRVDPGELLALDVKPLVYGPGPRIAGCRVFPPEHAFNVDVSGFPVHPNSANYLASIGPGNLHPDFGDIYGIPYTTVPGDQPRVPIFFDPYGDESDPGPYPIPPDAPIEGGSDRHVLVVDRDACVLYELFAATPVAGGWTAASGAIWDLAVNAMRPPGWTSADAAGLPILPGLVRYEEVVEQGVIRHALRFTVSRTMRGYIPPASHFASSSDDPNLPPMGLRLRLRADFDISGFHPYVQVILRALKQYGMIVADNGSDWFITGALDPRWDNTILDQLKTVSGSNFEVVYTGPVVTP